MSAWSVVRNPDPAHGGPLRLLDGWRFTAAFEDATVERSKTVTHITEENADPAFWEIEFTGAGPARAVVTVLPREGAQLLDVGCVWSAPLDFDQHPVAASPDGNSIAFEVGRGVEIENDTYPQDYECFFTFAQGTVPQTDTVTETPTSDSRAHSLALAMLAGIAAGVLVLTSRRHRPSHR